jgi:hypothetical protein
MYSKNMRCFAVVEIYTQLISLTYPILSIAVAVSIYSLALDSTRNAYSSFNSQLTTLGGLLTNKTEELLTNTE